MKRDRQNAIRQLLREREIQTQDELAEALQQMGFQVTQATVSRDIKAMRLIKTSRQGGGYYYAEPEYSYDGLNDRFVRLLRDCVVSVEAAGQMIVVKTMSGAANTAAEALDSMDMPEIMGSIAGDNTIFLVARDHFSATEAVQRVRSLIR